MSTDTTEPTTPFLQRQAEIMAQRAAQERDAEERRTRTLVPAAPEQPRPTFTPRPVPQRIQPSGPLEKTELSSMIEELRSDMAEAQSLFDRKDELDAAAAIRRQELSATIEELTQRLNEARVSLDHLNAQGSTRDQFIASAITFETRISPIASGVFNYVLDRLAQEKYESPFRDLTPLLQEEILFRAGKLGVKRLAQGSWPTLHKQRRENLLNDTVNASMERTFDATITLEKALEK